MGDSTTTTLTELIPIIIATAEWTRQAGTVIRPLIKEFDISGKDGNTLQLPILAAAGRAGDTTEGDDYVTTTTLDSGSGPANIQCKIIKHIFLATDLSDLSIKELGSLIGEGLGQAMANKIEYDLQQLFSGFSQTVAGATVGLALAHFDSAMQQLRAAHAPGPYNAVLSTKQIWGPKGISEIFPRSANYRDTAAPPGTPAGAIAEHGFAAEVLGFRIHCSTVIVTDGGDDDAGGFLSQKALALVMKSKKMVYETDRDVSAGETEHVGWLTLKAAEYKDLDGVYCLSDVSVV